MVLQKFFSDWLPYLSPKPPMSKYCFLSDQECVTKFHSLGIVLFTGNRDLPADSEHRQSHMPVAKFRFDIGHMAKQILSSTSDTECKHLSLIVEGLETQLRIATLSRIVDLINDMKPAEVLPMRIDAFDVRLTLQVCCVLQAASTKRSVARNIMFSGCSSVCESVCASRTLLTKVEVTERSREKVGT